MSDLSFAEASALDASVDLGPEVEELFDAVDDMGDDDLLQEDAAEEYEEELARREAEKKKKKRQTQEELYGADVDDIFHTRGVDEDEEDVVEAAVDELINPKKSKKKSGAKRRKQSKLPPHMALRVGEANLAYAAQEYQKAVEHLLVVIKECPNAPEPFLTLGLIYEEWNQPDLAAEYLMIAAHLLVKDAALWKRVGNLWRDQGDPRRALYCYNRAIKFFQQSDKKSSSPSAPSYDYESMWQRAMLYRALGEYRKGIDAVMQYLTIRPNDPEAIKELARLYHLSSQVERSESLLSQYAQRMRDALEANEPGAVLDLDIVNMLSETYITQAKHEKACDLILWAQTAFKPTPSQPSFPIDLTVNYGLGQLFLKNTAQAVRSLQKLLTESPIEFGDLFWSVGAALADSAEYEEALRYFEPLLDSPTYGGGALWSYMARCYRALDQPLKAFEYYEKTFDVFNDLHTCVALSEICGELNQHDRGIEIVKRFLEIRRKRKPESATAAATTGAGAATVGEEETPEEHEKNLLLAEEQRKLEDDELRALARMAKFYYQMGEYESFLEIVNPVVIDADRRFFRFRVRQRSKFAGVGPDHIDLPEERDPSRRKKSRKGGKAASSASASNGARLVDEIHAAEDIAGQKQKDSVSDAPAGSKKLSVIELIGTDQYIYLFTAAVRTLGWLGNWAEAHRLMEICFYYIRHEQEAHVSEHESMKMRYLASRVALKAGDAITAERHLRLLLFKDIYNAALWSDFYRVMQQESQRMHTGIRFVQRLYERNPDCIPMRLIVGHFSQLTRSHRMALAEYLPAYMKHPENSNVTFSVGLCYLNQTMNRNLADRNFSVMQAFAFLFRYGDLEGWSQEALYNVGRAFHQLNLVNFAVYLYEKALEAGPRTIAAQLEILNGNFERMDLDEDQNRREELERDDLCREIAYNLSLIYKRSGSHHLAREVLARYITI